MNYELNHRATGGIERAVEDVAAVGLELKLTGGSAAGGINYFRKPNYEL